MSAHEQKQREQPRIRARLSVMRVHVEPAQVWFHCPRCDEALEGYYMDPRGQRDVTCDTCGEQFDVPASAHVVIA